MNTIQDHEEVLIAGPQTQYITAVVESLAQEGIVSREVRIDDVPTSCRPAWACTPADEVYVIVLRDQLLAARAVVPWVSRVCLKCGSVLLAKAHNCQDCGTQHDMEPGDRSVRMNPQYGILFKTIDDYVRAQHHCFVTECFLNPHSRNEWVICLRPTEDNTRILAEQACKYVRLSLKEVEEICAANALSPALTGRIDGDLHSITDRQT